MSGCLEYRKMRIFSPVVVDCRRQRVHKVISNGCAWLFLSISLWQRWYTLWLGCLQTRVKQIITPRRVWLGTFIANVNQLSPSSLSRYITLYLFLSSSSLAISFINSVEVKKKVEMIIAFKYRLRFWLALCQSLADCLKKKHF